MVKHSPFKGRTARSVLARGTNLIDMEKYLNWRWKRYNHRKYHKYYQLWRDNVTGSQLEFFQKEMTSNKQYIGV